MRLTILSRDYGFTSCVFDLDSKKELFKSTDKGACKCVAERIKSGLTFVDFVEEKVYAPKLLIVNGRHYTGHYLINNPEELDEVGFGLLERLNMSGDIQTFEIVNTTLTIDYIESCPDYRIKQDLMTKYDYEIKNIRDIELHNMYVNKIIHIIETNEKTGSFSVLRNSSFLDLELKEFDKI